MFIVLRDIEKGEELRYDYMVQGLPWRTTKHTRVRNKSPIGDLAEAMGRSKTDNYSELASQVSQVE